MAFKFRYKHFYDEQKLPIIIISTGVILLILSLFLDKFISDLFTTPKNQYLTYFFEQISNFTFIFSIVALYTTFILYLEENKKAILPLWITLVITLAITIFMKILIARTRPNDLNFVFSGFDYSFPSQHTAFAFAVLPIIFRLFPKYKWHYLTFACIIAFSRIYLNVHYLSDVVAGALIGYLIGWFVLTFKQKYHYLQDYTIN